ncbi:hypothetical protein M9978_02515 [Sphingomonas sp. MG17]|uniref:Uncharacterized protein n=1 Tax=Sphingomonas tagetis TaxID=2949092 RepID=A0A9X2HMY7_9SPHN|nr:hypothetical protein [Sphingomonas tagetis]MCP3729290.1 hypothetical protein [Sphingomonas tagetis]
MSGRRAAIDRLVATPIWPVDHICPPQQPVEPLAPMREHILVGPEDGRCVVTNPSGFSAIAPIGRGIALAWAPAPELGGVALSQFIALGPDRGIVTIVSRPGLKRLIADLQSIDAQLGDAS